MTARATPRRSSLISGSGINAGEYFTCAARLWRLQLLGVDYGTEPLLRRVPAPTPATGSHAGSRTPRVCRRLRIVVRDRRRARRVLLGRRLGRPARSRVRGDQNEPALVSVTGTIVGGAVGTHHACAIRDVGTVAWGGRDSAGQRGDGLQAVLLPQMVTHCCPAPRRLAVGRARARSSVARSTVGARTSRSSSAMAAAGPSARADPDACHERGYQRSDSVTTSCARLTNGDVCCWGASVGQLGEGDDLSTPVQTMASNCPRSPAATPRRATSAAASSGAGAMTQYGQLGDGGGCTIFAARDHPARRSRRWQRDTPTCVRSAPRATSRAGNRTGTGGTGLRVDRDADSDLTRARSTTGSRLPSTTPVA